jgi:hypothetical protein
MLFLYVSKQSDNTLSNQIIVCHCALLRKLFRYERRKTTFHLSAFIGKSLVLLWLVLLTVLETLIVIIS